MGLEKEEIMQIQKNLFSDNLLEVFIWAKERIRNSKKEAELRQFLITIYSNKCVVHGCNSKVVELDHVFPFAKGGTTEATNGVLRCSKHNKQKGDRLLPFPKAIVELMPQAYKYLNDRDYYRSTVCKIWVTQLKLYWQHPEGKRLLEYLYKHSISEKWIQERIKEGEKRGSWYMGEMLYKDQYIRKYGERNWLVVKILLIFHMIRNEYRKWVKGCFNWNSFYDKILQD